MDGQNHAIPSALAAPLTMGVRQPPSRRSVHNQRPERVSAACCAQSYHRMDWRVVPQMLNGPIDQRQHVFMLGAVMIIECNQAEPSSGEDQESAPVAFRRKL